MVTYPSLKQVPRVVDSADGACPAAACTVQSHTRKKKTLNTHNLHKFRKKKEKLNFIKGGGSHTCLRVLDSSSLRPRAAWRRTPHERQREITALVHRRHFESCWVTEEPRETSSGCSLRTFYEETGCLPVWEAASVCSDEPGPGASCSVLTLAYVHTCPQPLPFYPPVQRAGSALQLPSYTGTTCLPLQLHPRKSFESL